MLNNITQAPLKYIQRYNMNNQLGLNIKALRKKLHLTQEQFADKIGVSSQAVSKWETGICYPDISLLPLIAQLFGITIDELLGFSAETRLDMSDKTTYDRMQMYLVLHGNAMLDCLEYIDQTTQDDGNAVSSTDTKKKIKMLKKILS